MTRIGRIIAASELVIEYAKLLEPILKPALEEFKAKTKQDVDMPHLICAVCYEAIKTGKVFDEEVSRQVKDQVTVLRDHLDEYLDLELSPEQQARLPFPAIIHYALFVEAVASFKHCFRALGLLLEGRADAGVDQIFNLWTASKMVSESADMLRTMLKAHGQISGQDYARIMTYSRGIAAKYFQISRDSGPKLKQALLGVRQRDQEQAKSKKGST